MSSGSQNWRIETNALDYLGHSKKKLELEQRRPVIRKASDLVGPGIGAGAVRIDDFNDLLARYDGFFSALPDAANAPPSTAEVPVGWIGFVSSDETLGGVQIFTDLATDQRYQRTFLRSKYDPTAIAWRDWVLL